MATHSDIQKGDSTHHQDQLMTLPSFNPMKRSPSKPINPTPPEDDFESLMVFYCALVSPAQAGRLLQRGDDAFDERAAAVLDRLVNEVVKLNLPGGDRGEPQDNAIDFLRLRRRRFVGERFDCIGHDVFPVVMVFVLLTVSVNFQ